MRRLSKQISLLAVSVFAVGSFGVAPVFAEASTSVNTDTKTTVSGDDTSVTGSTSVSTSTESHKVTGKPISTESTDSRLTANDEASASRPGPKDLRASAQQLLQADRQNKKEKSVADRQKACQAHQAELTTREANYAKAGQTHLDTFNDIYAKVLAYQTDKQLPVSNYADLKAQADTWKTNAEASVVLLSGTDVKIDCTSSDPASSVAALKTAVSGARNALQQYRTAIKNLIVAMLAAKDTTAKSTTVTSGSASTDSSDSSTNTTTNTTGNN